MTTLRQAVQEYVRMRRDLGFKLQEAGKGLLDFVAFMEQHRASSITQALALAWAQQPSNVQPAHWARRLSFVRGFARYRSATDPRTQIPAPGLLPFQPKRARPYLYSDAEIRDLLRAARTMPCRYERGQLRPWVYYCLFGLLSVSGLRLGEARNLELHDVDLKAAVLTIRGAKFGKTRLVPLHASTCHVLADVPPPTRTPLGAAAGVLLCVRLQLGQSAWIAETFIARSTRCPGRSVCAARPTVMARGSTTCDTDSPRTRSCAGIGRQQDPERKLPLLSAYLGHVHVADTQWYLSGSPELMREAMRRLEHRWEDRP